jgi:two-component system, chemotaxis family, protein-glutamate methylesterase/glutaminase
LDSSQQLNPAPDATLIKAVVIGASTGGPSAIMEILRELPNTLHVPVFVGQHMPAEFVPGFVNGLSRDAHIPVEMASQNEVAGDGRIYVAPGDSDMKVIRDPLGKIHMLLVPPSTTLTPSIDVLMASVATVYGTGTLGIILTGMGVDGLEGMRAIKAVGGKTIVQDEATSAVYGMAQAVDNEHLADIILPLPAIAGAIAGWSVAP